MALQLRLGHNTVTLMADTYRYEDGPDHVGLSCLGSEDAAEALI